MTTTWDRLLDPEIQAAITDLIAKGNLPHVACAIIGIPVSTYEAFHREAHTALTAAGGDFDAVPDDTRPFVLFAEKIVAAKATFAQRATGQLLKSAFTEGNTADLRWVMTRTLPEWYAEPKNRVEVSGPNAGPITTIGISTTVTEMTDRLVQDPALYAQAMNLVSQAYGERIEGLTPPAIDETAMSPIIDPETLLDR
jgi:hypothetical protein